MPEDGKITYVIGDLFKDHIGKRSMSIFSSFPLLDMIDKLLF